MSSIVNVLMTISPVGGENATADRFPRTIAPAIVRALADTPVVMLVGPRQTGKSTLVQDLVIGSDPVDYVTLDDAVTLAAATADPTGFVAGGAGLRVIDEVQRAPDLLLAIKAAVDRDRRPGRFLLTGSADVLALPRVSESLAGRVEVLSLWPLSQAEIERQPSTPVIGRLLTSDATLPTATPIERPELIRRLVRGGFPPAVLRDDAERRSSWLASYLTTMTQRDVRDLANIAGVVELPRLLRALALRTTQPLNKSGVASALGMPYATIDRYVALLEALFLVHRIPAWHGNLGRRLAKAPKVLITDSGLAAHLVGADETTLGNGTADLGAAVESFVGMELVRLASLDPVRATVHHYRATGGREVDFLLEAPDGRVVGVEVKAAATVERSGFRHLADLRDALGERFVRGVVLHAGSRATPFGERLAALPLSVLWATG